MAWQIIALIIINLILIATSLLLTPKPEIENARPKDLGDFSFPTASEDRAIPIIWGTVKIAGPNVVWYGDLRTEAIEEEVGGGGFFGGGGEDVTVGFQYYVGMDFALCYGPIDTINRVEIGDRPAMITVLPVTDGTPVSVVNPNLFGGLGKGGGVSGTLRMYDGRDAPTINPYLQGILGSDLPAYVNICHGVWEQGLVGESTNIRPWSFQLSRYPDNLGLTGDGHKILPDAQGVADANPIECLYEIMTDTVWGMGIDPTDIDTAAFTAAGNTVATEENGFSMTADSPTQAKTLADEIIRQVDGALYQKADGTFTITLVRGGDSIIRSFDETNIAELSSFTRSGWSETQNHVNVAYVDRNKDFIRTGAVGQDLANVQIQNGQVRNDLNFPGIKHSQVARDVAGRELKQASFPLAKVDIVTNREGAAILPGQLVNFSWSRLAIVNMVLRVLQVDLGDLQNGKVKLSCIQDIFKLSETLFDETEDTGWTAIDDSAQVITTQLGIEYPRFFYEINSLTLGDGNILMTVARRPGAASLKYHLYVDDAGGAGFIELNNASYTANGTLQAIYPADTAAVDTTAQLVVENLDNSSALADKTAGEIQQFGQNMAYIEGATPGESEIVGWETIVDNGDGTFDFDDVHRGLLDTAPIQHAVGARIWFFSGAVNPIITNQDYTDTQAITFRQTDETTTDEDDVSAASSVAFTFDERPQRPLRPGNVTINTARFPVTSSLGVVNLTVAWAHRNVLDTTAWDDDDVDSPLGQNTDVEYILTFFDVTTETQINQFVLDNSSPPPTGGTWTSFVYNNVDIVSDSGFTGTRVVRVEIFSRSKADNTLTSLVTVKRFVTIGFQFDTPPSLPTGQRNLLSFFTQE